MQSTSLSIGVTSAKKNFKPAQSLKSNALTANQNSANLSRISKTIQGHSYLYGQIKLKVDSELKCNNTNPPSQCSHLHYHYQKFNPYHQDTL